MLVKEFMSPNPVVAEVPGRRIDALLLMAKHGFSGLPVVDAKGNYVGVVTRRAIMENPEEDQLSLLVRRDVEPVHPEDDVSTAAERMLRHGVRHLPVVEDSRVVGVLTPMDLLRVIEGSGDERPVSHFMRRNIFPVYEGTPLSVVFQAMRLSGLYAMPVVDEEGRLTGIVTDVDLFKTVDVDVKVAFTELGVGDYGDYEQAWTLDHLQNVMKFYYTIRKLKVPKEPVKKVMTPDPLTVFEEDPINEVARHMRRGNFGQLPVLDENDELCGMVFDLDLMKALVG